MSQSPPPQPGQPSSNPAPQLYQRLWSLITRYRGRLGVAGCLLLLLVTGILGLIRSPWWYVPLLILLAVLGIIGIITLIRLGYRHAWTGLPEYSGPPGSTDIAFQRARTLWDWSQLLIIPIFLLIAALVFGLIQNAISFQMSDTQHKNDMNLAATQQAVDKAAADKQNREAVLAAYQSSITDLLLNHKLGIRNVVKPDDQEAARISAISARSLTLVTVRRLDGDQKGFLIQFLYNAQLINQGHPIISLNTADLSRINLSGIKLRGINLSGAVMTGSDLSGADLTQAYLWGATLSKDSKANQQTNLKGATLIGAYLWGANLSDADLSGAKLSGADLSGTNLSGADLRDAIRDGVDFCYTIVTNDTCPPRPSSSGASDLGDDAPMWSSFMAKQGEVPVPVHNVANVTAPSYDNNDQSDKRDNNGSALQVFLLGGDPYTNIQAYRSVSLDNTKTNFDLSLSFYITPFNISEVPPIQALEFRVSSGPNATVALQWQQISATQSQQDNLPNWRVGNGTSWEDLKQSQQKLLAGKWYTLHLTGEIVGNEMHFLNFSCMNDFGVANDNVSSSLDRLLALSPNMKIGMQLDGNAHEDPYDVYLDGVDFNQT